MKTKCYCVYCSKHPLHNKRKEFKKILTGFSPDHFIGSEFDEQAADVDCLEVESAADGYVDLNDFDYEKTAYGDGCAVTGSDAPGLLLYASCGNEDYEE